MSWIDGFIQSKTHSLSQQKENICCILTDNLSFSYTVPHLLHWCTIILQHNPGILYAEAINNTVWLQFKKKNLRISSKYLVKTLTSTFGFLMILSEIMPLGWGPVLFTLQLSDLQHFSAGQVVINILEKDNFLFYTVKFKKFTPSPKADNCILTKFHTRMLWCVTGQERNQKFRRTYWLHLQGEQSRKTASPWRWSFKMLTSIHWQSVTSQKI